VTAVTPGQAAEPWRAAWDAWRAAGGFGPAPDTGDAEIDDRWRKSWAAAARAGHEAIAAQEPQPAPGRERNALEEIARAVQGCTDAGIPHDYEWILEQALDGLGWLPGEWERRKPEPQPAPDLSAGLADLESELRDVTRQIALCRSTKIPCVFCEQEITRAMGAVRRWAQDVAEHERTREPRAAPELADAMRETRRVSDLLDDFTHAAIDCKSTPHAIAKAAHAVRKKAGLPPVEGQ